MSNEDMEMLKKIFWYLKLSGEDDMAKQLSDYIVRYDSRLCAVKIPNAPSYEIGDDGYIDQVYCDHTLRKHVTCERDTNGEWRRTVRYI